MLIGLIFLIGAGVVVLSIPQFKLIACDTQSMSPSCQALLMDWYLQALTAAIMGGIVGYILGSLLSKGEKEWS